MLQAIMTMQFGINCIVTNSDYNTCYVISIGNRMDLHAIKE